VLVRSTNVFDKLFSMAASMPKMFLLIFLPSSTKAGMRHRWAQASHSSSMVRARTPFVRMAMRSCSFIKYAR
jgi:hypothetical protein